MKNIRKIFMFVLSVVMIATLSVVPAFADSDLTNDDKAFIEQHVHLSGDRVVGNSGYDSLTRYLTTDASEALGGSDATELFNINGTSVYIHSSTNESRLHSWVTRYNNDIRTARDVADDTISDLFDVGGDTDRAAEMLSGFMPYVRLLIGFMIIAITMLMTIYTSFDIAYIAFPLFRNKCEEAKASGNPAMTKGSTTPGGENKLRFVTDDAVNAIKETNENGRSPWGIYFKKRLVSYILLAIVLFVLLTGNISLITSVAINMVTGIMGVLQTLGG